MFVNLYKKYAWKLRSARFVHWNFRKIGKLNERRYIKLLGAELQLIIHLRLTQFLSHVLTRCFCFVISWFNSKKILPDTSITYNGVQTEQDEILSKGDIVEIPTGDMLFKEKNKYSQYFRRLIKRAKKYSYNTFLLAKRRVKRSRSYTIPKAYKKLPIGLKKLNKTVTQENSIGAITFVKKIPSLFKDIESIVNKTSVLALQIWRYRFD